MVTVVYKDNREFYKFPYKTLKVAMEFLASSVKSGKYLYLQIEREPRFYTGSQI